MQDTINNLSNTIIQLKKKNNTIIDQYIKEIKSYRDNIDIINNQIKKFTLENTNLKEEIKKINIQNNSDDIIRLYKKIEELNEKINRYPFILEKDEKMLSVVFATSSITYSMICKNTDSIYKLEGELYQKFPELAESNNYFLFKGTVLNRFKKFEEFHFKNGEIIIIQ